MNESNPMENSNQIRVISNIVINPLANSTNPNDTQENSESLNNLSDSSNNNTEVILESPISKESHIKRKNLHVNPNTIKRRKTIEEICSNEVILLEDLTKGDSQKDVNNEEVKIFNYMTGSYEVVEKSNGLPNSSGFVESEVKVEEDITIDESSLEEKYNITDPLVVRQNEDNTTKLHCSNCSFETDKRELLKKHKESHKITKEINKNITTIVNLTPIEIDSDDAAQHHCSKCSFETDQREMLEKHEESHKNTKLSVKEIHKNIKTIVNVTPIEIDSSSSSSSSSSSDSETFFKYKCYHCNFETDRKDTFKSHTHKHRDQKFRCSLHLTKLDNCRRCTYETTLSDIVKELWICTSCGYKTGQKNAYKWHKKTALACKAFMNKTAMFQCFHCDSKYKCHKYLKYHAVEHFGQEFTCEEHRESETLFASCPECVYQQILQNLDQEILKCDKCGFRTCRKEIWSRHKCRTVTKSANQTIHRKPPSTFNCYHCMYITMSKSHLKNHAVAHLDTPYECDCHPKEKDAECCTKCIYETICKNLQRDVYRCENCGYKSYLWGSMERHRSSTFGCQVHEAALAAQRTSAAQQTEFWCWDCDFHHEQREMLEEHAKIHFNSRFSCREHAVKVNNACTKCVYADILRNLPKKPLECFDCSSNPFASKFDMRDHIKQHHVSSMFKCNHHKTEKDKECSMCVYENEVHSIMKYLCHECFFRSSLKQFVMEHIKDRHIDSTYECDEHPTRKNFENCRKCMYEDMLKQMKSESVTQKLLEVMCFDCNMEVLASTNSLKRHIVRFHRQSMFRCSTHEVEKKKDCSMCVYDSKLDEVMTCECGDCNFRCLDSKVFLKHIKEKHANSYFACNVHQNGEKVANCRKCLYQGALKNLKYTKVKRNCTNLGYTCFDCHYKGEHHNALKKHVKEEHRDSTFQCSTHTLGDIDRSCSKCTYERILVRFKENVEYQCSKCDFDTSSKKALHKHSVKEHSTRNLKSVLNLSCYECGYETFREDLLRKHVNSLMHFHSMYEFKCEEHFYYQKTCKACIFEKLWNERKGACREILRCHDCNFKSRDKSVLRVHIQTHQSKSASDEIVEVESI